MPSLWKIFDQSLKVEMEHEYYIAKSGIMHGDANDLKELYESFGIQKPTTYDGASRYIRESKLVVVVLLRNFFSEKECVSVFEL